jgi:hypothetical protein
LATVPPPLYPPLDTSAKEAKASAESGWWARQDSNLRPTGYESCGSTKRRNS